MFTSSRFAKFHARHRRLARLKIRGDEIVLDVGCAHRDRKEAFATGLTEMTLPRGRVRYYLD